MQGDFTLSYHYYRQLDGRNHLELFLDTDGKSPLETWRSFAEAGMPRRFVAAPLHRRAYLGFAGHVSGGRGKLRILRRGKFIDRRTRRSKVCAAQDVHLGADQSAGPHSIKVTL